MNKYQELRTKGRREQGLTPAKSQLPCKSTDLEYVYFK